MASNGSELGALIKIAEERSVYTEKLKEALESGDDAQLKFFARKLCGMSTDPHQE